MWCSGNTMAAKGSSIVTSVVVRLFRVPLDQVLSDAKHGDHTHFELITTTVTTADGLEGVGYTYTGGKGGRAIKALIEDDLTPAILDQDSACIEKVWHDMQWRIHYVGRGGIASFSISAVDIALWDLKCQRAGLPLWKLAGGASGRVRCYGGGIDLHMTEDELLENVRKYRAQGHTAFKIKLGRPTVAEDLARTAAVRELIGPDATLMVDANMGWSVATAITASKGLAKLNVLWLEEPVIPDDFTGTKRVGDEGGIAIAGGENLHTIHEFTHAITVGRLDYPEPDASNIGGITGWLKVATLCEAHNLPVCSHGMQELHVSLLAAVPNAGWMEVHSFPIDKYTEAGPVTPTEGYALPPSIPGTGVRFLWDQLAPHEAK